MPEQRCFGYIFDVLRQTVRCSAFAPPHSLASDSSIATAYFLWVRRRWKREWDFLFPLKRTGMSGAQLVSDKERTYPHNPVLIARSIFHSPQPWHNEHTPVQTYILSSFLYSLLLFVRARTEWL